MNSTKFGLSVSAWAVTIAILFMAVSRLTHINEKETAWDVLGYYLPLPATFIYDDPMMSDRTWITKVNDEQHLTGTLYQVTTTDEGEPMYFFLFGMSLFYLPFFLIGHAWAAISGAPMDGFSEPYQLSLVFGGVIYTFLGLLLLRKILLKFFSQSITAMTILIVVFATNYSHHLGYKNLETVNILFLLMCWLIWSTLRWHEEYKLSHLIQIGCAITLMALVKPSEVMALFIPLLWSVTSWKTFKEKLQLLWQKRLQLLLVIGICLLIASPQMLYWKLKTGHFIFDSYRNPGIGLDIFSPHIFDVLFSYRKGWLVYTPVMLLGLIGLVILFRKRKTIGFSLVVYFLISFYIICSWTEWWYGAAFSCRPVITAYPILAIGIAMLFTQLNRTWMKAGVALFAILCVALNQFQQWQLMNGIYDPYRTTKAYYWATFLKTKTPANAEELKLVYRSFEPNQQWTDPERYYLARSIQLIQGKPQWYADEFSPVVLKEPYEKLTPKDHAWIDLEIEYETTDSAFTNGPFLVTTMLYKDKAYGYMGPDLLSLTDTLGNHRYKAHFRCMTPEARTKQDLFTTYIWNPGKNNIRIHSYRLRSYVRKH